MKLKLFLVILLIATTAFGITIANGEMPDSRSERLYFVTTAGKITLEWAGGGPEYVIRMYSIKREKYYPVEDLDGDYTNLEATVQAPVTGHLLVECCSEQDHTNPDYLNCARGIETRTEDEPMGWYIFAEPAAPTGGGISSSNIYNQYVKGGVE